MTASFAELPFQTADILLPVDCDLSLWSVVACDQYTSQPEYWQRVEERVGRAPSTLRLILPESCLEGPGVETDIMEINNTMTRYLREGRFRTLRETMVYTERTLDDGSVRCGLIGKVDLTQYSYEPNAAAAIRATEETVMERIPPRVKVRKNAPIELPHAMLLADDPEDGLFSGLRGARDDMELLYDFDLMENAGHVRGWRLDAEQLDFTASALRALQARAVRERNGLLFAVGDGNHSLAAAKECYERRKRLTAPEQWLSLPSRFALAELVNLHDPAVSFHPIHRVVFGAEPQDVLNALCRFYPGAKRGVWSEDLPYNAIPYAYGDTRGSVTLPGPAQPMPVHLLQTFLDSWLRTASGVRVDYIHGRQVACQLALRPRTTAFLMPSVPENELFSAVARDGAFPPKSFSIGRAQDKRFYLEARKIRA